MDWELVAAFRSQASELLTKQLGGDRLHLDKAAQEALGRSVIVELLEAAAASDASTAVAAHQKVYDWLTENHAIAPIYHDARLWAYRSQVKGFNLPATDYEIPSTGISVAG